MTNDNRAVDALQTGEADVERTFATPLVAASAKKSLQVADIPPPARVISS